MKVIVVICGLWELITIGEPIKWFPFTGMKKRQNSPRIIGGQDAVPHAYPHLISLQVFTKTANDYQHNCGGSILNPYYVITAKHCVQNMTFGNIRIVAGAHNINDKSEKWQIRKLQKIIFYPDPKKRPPSYIDVVLLKMISPFVFDATVKEVILPSYDFTPNHGDFCSLAGWGVIKENPTVMPKKLQMIYIPIVTGIKCTNQPLRHKVVPGMEICAGKINGDGCRGDSGGPLLCPEKTGKIVLTGVFSRLVIPCTKQKFPGVSSRVGFFLKWIKKEIKN